MYQVDFDKQISEFKKKIEELEEQKASAERRNEGFRAFDDGLKGVFEEYGLTEYDLYLMKSVNIGEWLKSLKDKEIRPDVYEELKAFFGKLYAKEAGLVQGKRKTKGGKATKANGVKLAIGVYANPHTGESVEKKRRNPRQLDEWVEEFGAEEVTGWIQLI